MFVNPDRCRHNGIVNRKRSGVMVIWLDGNRKSLNAVFIGSLEQHCAVFKPSPIEMPNMNFIAGTEMICKKIERDHSDGISQEHPSELLCGLLPSCSRSSADRRRGWRLEGKCSGPGREVRIFSERNKMDLYGDLSRPLSDADESGSRKNSGNRNQDP